MYSGNPALIDFIRQEIQRLGPIGFDRFMQQALYHPELGYYSSGRCSIGRRGDYITNVSIGSLFGRLLAAQFSEMWERLGRPSDFVVVEQGAHHGDFARDVLESLREQSLFSILRYSIIEPSRILRERQKEMLGGFVGKVSWVTSFEDLDPFRGVHFSNELLDAMPVHLVRRFEEGWQERCVADGKDDFVFVDRPITNAELQSHLEMIPSNLSSPYATEVNLAALKWIENVAKKLDRGYVLVVDFGYPRDELYAPERREGTLQCYAKHHVVPSPFVSVGETDISARIDWTSLAARAMKHGLQIGGFADQHHFVAGVIGGLMREESVADDRTKRALQTLLHPELLGRAFQFLVLAKGVSADAPLGGFHFGGNARVALGI